MIWDQLSRAEKAKVGRERLVETRTQIALDIAERISWGEPIAPLIERYVQVRKLIEVVDVISGIRNFDTLHFSEPTLLDQILAIKDGWST